MSGEVHVVTTEVGALSNAKRPLWPCPSNANGGGLTVLEAHVTMGGSANSGLILSKGTMSGGTYTANGTIAASIGGTALWAANVTLDFTIGSGNFVDAAEWVAIEESNLGAAATVTIVEVSYVMGR